jgi:hypothetical protein
MIAGRGIGTRVFWMPLGEEMSFKSFYLSPSFGLRQGRQLQKGLVVVFFLLKLRKLLKLLQL